MLNILIQLLLRGLQLYGVFMDPGSVQIRICWIRIILSRNRFLDPAFVRIRNIKAHQPTEAAVLDLNPAIKNPRAEGEQIMKKNSHEKCGHWKLNDLDPDPTLRQIVVKKFITVHYFSELFSKLPSRHIDRNCQVGSLSSACSQTRRWHAHRQYR